MAARKPKALTQALENVERATTLSKQPRLGAVDKERMFTSFYRWIKNTQEAEPAYASDSRKRDKWLSEMWRKEPHLAGVINTVVSIDRNRDFTITGGRNVVNRYTNILRSAEDGEGWRYFAGRAALSFYTSDLGAVTEIGRDGIDGPARAFYNVDPSRCYLTGNANTPLSYTPASSKEQLWQPGDYFRTTPLPSIDESFYGLGYCAVSRCWPLVQLLMAVYEHDMEKLGARAPKGLLLLQNISEQQWEDAMKAREANLSKLEREYYGGVAILAQEGVDQIDAKLVALSQLPDNLTLEQVVKLVVIGYALCTGYDPIEFYPIETGALGRGRESEIQHMKATGKGGIEFIRTYQDRLQGELPPTLLFEFEQRDIQGQLSEAEVQKAWADVYAVYAGATLLSIDEIRQLMVQRGIIPAEWTQAEEQAQADSTGEQRSWLDTEAVWRSVFTDPRQPIVSYASKTNRTQVLAPSGYWLLQQHRHNQTARSVYEDMPVVEFREVFGHRVFPVLTMRADAQTLYDDDDVTITTADVARAINTAKKRVGKEFADLLMAEPEAAE
jgi:hypothetical protein